MIEEIYNDLQKEVKQGKDLTLSKSDMTILLEQKLGELPSSINVADMWMDRFRLPLVIKQAIVYTVKEFDSMRESFELEYYLFLFYFEISWQAY
jgi:hypothetical protein